MPLRVGGDMNGSRTSVLVGEDNECHIWSESLLISYPCVFSEVHHDPSIICLSWFVLDLSCPCSILVLSFCVHLGGEQAFTHHTGRINRPAVCPCHEGIGIAEFC